MADVKVESTSGGTTASATCAINSGYVTSWQGILKIVKTVFLLVCLICAGYMGSRIGWRNSEIDYCIAISVIGLFSEILIFFLYLCSVTARCSSSKMCSIMMLIYHLLMVILIFTACIIITGWGVTTWNYSGYQSVNLLPAARAFNAFGIFTLLGFILEVYFNIIWLTGGPELAALPVSVSTMTTVTN